MNTNICKMFCIIKHRPGLNKKRGTGAVMINLRLMSETGGLPGRG